MVARVSNSVWWPGMNNNIRAMRANCRMCNSNTSSQAKAPLPDPQYPCKQICSDYFTLEARQCLVFVDRYSGWPSVQQAKKGNASELINFLRTHFETFWAPEVLTSDGGPQYISSSGLPWRPGASTTG